MLSDKKILAIIPARGGSKRLPDKNIKLLAGKPLLAHAIIQAKKSRYIDRVVVSTENKKIAGISKQYRAEVIARPKELAACDAKVVDAVFHALEFLNSKNYVPDIVVLVQPTSPLRTAGDIDRAIERFLKNKCEMVMSVCEVNSPVYRSLKMEKKYLKPVLGREYISDRGQDLPKIYIANGAIYILTPKIIKKYQAIYASKILPYFMPAEKSIDIDDEADFKKAEKLMNKKKNGIKKQ